MEIVTIGTPELGDRSYVVGESGSGGRAVVVDPQRDLDRVEAVLASEGWTCVLVVETHLHNDYVSGGLERSRRTGAEYAVHGGDEVSFQRRPVRDGDVLTVGALEVRVVDTPGHTEHHVSYVIGGQPAAVFSGGSLLYGAVGRTDLVHPGRTEIRSKVPAGKVRARSCCCQSMRLPTPAAAALAPAWDKTVAETSMAETCQPRPASQIASLPCPQPRSSAVAGLSGAATSTRTGLARPLPIPSCCR